MDPLLTVTILSLLTGCILLTFKYCYSYYISCLDSDSTCEIRSPCGSHSNCGCDIITSGANVVSSVINLEIPCCCSLSRVESRHHNEGEGESSSMSKNIEKSDLSDME
jgi:hypothetical protein